MSEPTHCFVGIMPGDIFGFICIDAPDYEETAGRDICWTLREGGTVERLTIEDGRRRVAGLASRLWICPTRSTAG